MRATKIALRMGAVLLVASFAATPLRAGEPTGPVADLNATLLESMQQARALGFNGRYELLSPVLIDTSISGHGPHRRRPLLDGAG